MKFLFWSLLCLNGTLFAYGKGYLGSFKGNQHEPARIKNALNAERINLITLPEAQALVRAASLEAATPVEPSPALSACIEIGNFSAVDGRRFEARLAPLALGPRLSRHNVVATEATSHIVFIPSLGNKEAADRKTGELKRMGVTDYFVISENTPMRWAISLGVFKSEQAAQTLLDGLIRQGVRSARMSTRGPNSKQLFYRVHDLNADTKAQLDKIKETFATQEIRGCK